MGPVASVTVQHSRTRGRDATGSKAEALAQVHWRLAPCTRDTSTFLRFSWLRFTRSGGPAGAGLWRGP